jgi:hypothetical protein
MQTVQGCVLQFKFVQIMTHYISFGSLKLVVEKIDKKYLWATNDRPSSSDFKTGEMAVIYLWYFITPMNGICKITRKASRKCAFVILVALWCLYSSTVFLPRYAEIQSSRVITSDFELTFLHIYSCLSASQGLFTNSLSVKMKYM